MSQAVQESNLSEPTDQEVAFRESIGRLSGLLLDGLSISGHEKNCCFMNTGSQRFVSASSVSGLNFSGDGRAYGRVDWDNDGDLDFWTTNRTSPRVQFFRNNSDGTKHFVNLLLEGNGKTTNRDAIGARVELVLQEQSKLKAIKTLHAGEGFLSQSSKWLLFGLGDQTQVDHVKVRWPGGESEQFSEIEADGHYRLVQGSGRAEPWSRSKSSRQWQASQPKPPEQTDQARIPLRLRIPMPGLHYNTLDGKQVAIDKDRGTPVLINFWASWCQPCLRELADFQKHHDQLAETGLKIVALSVDELAEDQSSNAKAARALVKKHKYAFPTGMATEDLIGNIESVLYFLFEHRRPWAVPTSILLDAEGRLSVIYVGRVEVEELMADVNQLTLDDQQWQKAALPLKGQWSGTRGQPNFAYLLKTYLDEGYESSAIKFIEHFGDLLNSNSRFPDLLVRSGIYLREKEGRVVEALAYFHRAADLRPGYFRAHRELGATFESQGQWKKAAQHYQIAVEANPNRSSTQFQLALALIQIDRSEEAIPHLKQAIQFDAALAGPYYHLAAIFLESGQLENAIEHFRKAYELEPENLATINGLAWTLAIYPKLTRQDSAEAVRLAEKAQEMTNNRHPQILDTLGAAYAAQGKFDKAIDAAERAVLLLSESGSIELDTEIRGRLKGYRLKRPASDANSR